MQRAALGALIVLALVAGPASAQTDTYAAFSVGFPLLGNVHVGFEDVLAPGVDLRLTLGGALVSIVDSVYYGLFGVDVLYRINHDDPDVLVMPYVGAGPGVGFAGIAGSSGFVFNGSGVVGVLLRVQDANAFIEARMNVLVAGGDLLPWPNIGVGLAFRL